MAIFKCKMCGGTLEIENESVAVCEYCGTKQTLPKLNDDRKANLYDRANHFRRNNEFDKAMGIYEQILGEDTTDAEAYWSLVLCRYGIEYVEDPATHDRVPTVNRAQFTSIFDDADYKSAIEYGDQYQQAVYESEAQAINEIQKGILAISQREEPFDVFICYKETDQNGRRTPDSVLANDLYHQLTQEGFRVFFSRITLEDKLGSAYEPYIFAALNSAKVMVALGTKPEFFNAVWVKNEWSRFLSLIKSGANKMLIPAYKDMDPYDLPEEFSHLQAQDMSKLGFMQDLIRGIKKIAGPDEEKTQRKESVIVEGGVHIGPLLKRAFLFLEDGDWQKADSFCEQVLNQDPENAQAYLGKLMAELHVKKQEGLADCEEPFDQRNNYQKIVRFGDEALVATLKDCVTHIKKRNELNRLTGIYNLAVDMMNAADNESAYLKAGAAFKSISGFQDADALGAQCIEQAEICRKDAVYSAAKRDFNHAGGSLYKYESTLKRFQTISGWRDTDELIRACQQRIEEIKAEKEAERIAVEKRRKRTRSIICIIVSLALAGIAFTIIYFAAILPAQNYNKASALMDAGKYEDALTAFNTVDFLDSRKKAWDCLFMMQKDNLAGVQVGSTVKFGAYEQDDDTFNGREEIEWEVLAVKDKKALLISKYALDAQPYHEAFEEVTWQTCTHRQWLNKTFFESAFGPEHRNLIQTTDVHTDQAITQDKIFLLSKEEANMYFDSNEARKCKGTTYCNMAGAYIGRNGGDWWRLRSQGDGGDRVAYVNDGGLVIELGGWVHYIDAAVRPAFWIDLEG